MLVSDIVNLLFSQYDVALAEPWDKPGLSVGSPSARVEAIACALDPTPTNIRLAKESGANVLVTHHPAFLEPPFPITPEAGTSSIGGASVYEAARLGVSLIAMHTNLDRSEDALDLIADKLSLGRIGRLQEPDGFGALLDASSLTLSELAVAPARHSLARPSYGENLTRLRIESPSALDRSEHSATMPSRRA